MNKKIFALLLLVFVVLSISAVSASDLDDTNQTLALDSSQINIAESSVGDSNVLEKSNNEEIIGISDSDNNVLGITPTLTITECPNELDEGVDGQLKCELSFMGMGIESQNVYLYVNGEQYASAISGYDTGECTFTLNFPTSGTYNVQCKYDGWVPNYDPCESDTKTITVGGGTPVVKTKVYFENYGNLPSTMDKGDDVTVSMIVYSDSSYSEPMTEPVRFKLTGKTAQLHESSDSTGIVTFSLSSLPVGTYSVSIIVDDENYEADDSIEFQLTVNGDQPVSDSGFDELYALLSASDVVTLEKDYKYTSADINKYFYLTGRSITINGNGHTIDASSENLGNYLFYMGAGSIIINNVVITNVKGLGIFQTNLAQLNAVTVTNSAVNDLIITSNYQSYIGNSKFINNTVTNILSGYATNIIQNVFLNNSISGYLLNSQGNEIEYFHNNVLINDNNAIIANYIGEKGNYRGTDGITINGPDKITTASEEYTFSLSNADLPEFDLLVDITSEYASLDKTVVTLGGGNTATVTVNAKKLGNATLTVGSDLVCDPIGTKSIEILYEKVKTHVMFDAYPQEVTVDEGSGSLSLNVIDDDEIGVSGVNVKLTANETVLNAVSGSEGAITFDLSTVPAGQYSAVVVVDDEDYESNPVTISLTVNEKVKTPVHLSDYTATASIVMTEGDARIYTATVEDINYGDVVVGVRVKLTAGDNVVYATSNQNGEAAFDLSGVGVFDGTAVVVVDDDNYKSSDSLSFTLTVNEKVKTPVHLSDYTATASIVMTEGDARIYTATVEDINYGDVVVGVRVKLTAGDNVVYATSNQNGEAAFDLSGVGVFDGTAVVVVDDDNYKSSDSLSFTLTVNEKVKTSVVISDFPGSIVMTEGEDVNFYAYVYDNLLDCTPISGARVKLTAEEYVYYATSDENGYVSFNLSDISIGYYTPSVVVDDENYKSDAITFTLTVKAKIEVDLEHIKPRTPTEIFIFEDESDTVIYKVIGLQSGQGIEGINVKFILNESEYNNISDSEGFVSFKISDLDAGFYNLTAEVDDKKAIYYTGQLPVDVYIISRDLTYTPQNYTADNIKVPYGGSVDWNVVNSAGRNIECEVTISTDSGSKTATVSGGNFTSDFSGLNAGEHEVTFSIENYTDKVFNIEILPVNTKTELIIPENPQVGTQITLKAKVNATTGQITFYVNGFAVEPVDVENGEASYPFTPTAVGNIKVSANYTDSEGNYNPSSDSGIVNVIKKSWELLDPAGQVIYYGESFNKMAFDGTVGITGDFTFKNDTSEFTLHADNGILNFNLILDAGTYTFNITNDIYEDKELTITINPAPTETNLTGPESITIGDEGSLTATVNTTSGQIEFYVNGNLNQTVELNDKNTTTFDLSVLPAGNYTITANYSDPRGNYKNSSASIKVTVNKIDTTITVEKDSLELKVDEDANITATLEPSEAGNLTYTSSNESVVTVDANGNIKAVGAGEATVTVSFAGNDKYNAAENKTVAVSVSKIATEISVFPPETIMIEQNISFYSAILDNETQYPIEGLQPTFTFSDENIVKIYYVGPTPIMQGISAGNVTITFSFAGNNKYAAAEDKVVTVTVLKIPADIIVENTNVTMNALDSVDVGATLNPKEAGNLTFTSSNPDVAEVVDGKIIAKTKGTATITVSLAENDKYGAENKTINVTVNLRDASVSVLNDTVSIVIDQVYDINATVVPDTLNVTYESSNPEVASVDNGVVTGMKNGTAVITLTVGDGKTYAINSTTVTVTVSKIPTKIIANNTLDMYVGDIASDIARLEPITGDNLNYTPFKPGIVKVEDGKIVALAEGTTIVIVNYFGNDKYASANSKLIKVTVKLRDASVSVLNDTVSIVINQVYDINATVVPDTLNVTYESSNPEVARVDNSVVTGLKEGTAVITLTVGDGKIYAINSTNVTVTVNKIPTEIIVNNATLDMKVGDGASDVAVLEPAAGNLNYTSSNPDVVKIEDGEIVAVGAGEATVTVSYAGNDKYAAAEDKTIFVTVSLRDASVSVLNDTVSIVVDDKYSINATVDPGELTIGYESSNPEVASVNNDGVVTGLKEGTAVITLTVGDGKAYAFNSTTVTVTVNKIPTEIIVNNATLDMKVGDGASDVAVLEPAAAGNLNYTSSNPDVVKIEDGEIVAVGAGEATVTVSYAGNDKYAAAEDKTIFVTVSLRDASVSVLNDTVSIVVDDKYSINATVDPGELTIGYESSNPEVASVNNDGLVTGLKEGTAVITLTVGDGKAYAFNSTTVTVTVSKIPTSISAKVDSELTVGDNSNVKYTLTPSDATGKVSFKSSNTKVLTVDAKGNVNAVGEGSATITVTYAGNNKYAPSNTTVSVKVSKSEIEPEIKQNDTTLTVTVPSDATGDVTVTIGDKTIKAPIKDGKAVIDLSDVPAGDYNATVSYPGDSKYSGFNVVSPVSIESKFQLIAENLTKYYHGSERFAVKAVDCKGNPISGVEVKIFVNGMTYTRITDENGSASIGVNLESGVYIATVTCNNTTVDATITVLTTVNGTDLVKVFRNATQYYATFRDSQGNYLKDGTTVRFNIHGVFYDRTVSGDKGLAKLNINIEQGKYIITAINLETGESRANNITVLPRIVENYDLTKYYRNASQYTVKLIGDDGKAVGAGENVTFNINGVFYTRTTNASGIAKLNINLQPGDYIITAGYKNCMVSNNIKVLPVLTAKDLTKKYGTKDQFTASLVEGQGKAYAGQSIQFNINGVFYNRITDGNGQAKLNINLQPGQYIITSSYDGASIANKVTVTA